MTKFERIAMVTSKIEELENNGVVVCGVKFADGRIATIEEIENDAEYFWVEALAIVSLKAYEENGFDTDGLEVTYEQV